MKWKSYNNNTKQAWLVCLLTMNSETLANVTSVPRQRGLA